jgi:hypothetical protein
MGYDIRTWTPITRDQSALFSSGNPSVESGKGQDAIFQLRSPAGDQGFPEDMIIEAYVAVVGPTPDEAGDAAGVAGEVYYNLRAAIVPREDDPKEARGTPINLTVHWGFNLEGGNEVLDHLLWLDVRSDQAIRMRPYASRLTIVMFVGYRSLMSGQSWIRIRGFLRARPSQYGIHRTISPHQKLSGWTPLRTCTVSRSHKSNSSFALAHPPVNPRKTTITFCPISRSIRVLRRSSLAPSPTRSR